MPADELSQQNRDLIERVRRPGEHSVFPAWIGRLLDAARLEALTRPLEGVEDAWQRRSEQVELALSQVTRAVRRVMDARDAFRVPDRGSHPNLVLEEAEAWVELKALFDPAALSPSPEASDLFAENAKKSRQEQIAENAKCSSPEAQPEPVAWRYRWRDLMYGEMAEWSAETDHDRAVQLAGKGGEVEPLYLAPSCDTGKIVREEPCTLADCPPGLFLADAYNTLGFKSEYRTEQGAIEAYVVESGEFFWGDTPQTVERQRAQIVRPISHAAVLSLLSVRVGGGEEIQEDSPSRSQPCGVAPSELTDPQSQHSDGGR